MRSILFCVLAGCSSSPTSLSPDLASGCALTQNTSATTTVTAGCALLDRDPSGCQASRSGLDGFWLKFSCRVSLTAVSGAVRVHVDGQPDYRSNYFQSTDACYTTSTTTQNPNHIVAQNVTLDIPTAPSGAEQAMTGAIVGTALNGVPIFANFAAPGDDIFQEARTFDACQGHPQMTGVYHYHAEPYAISYDDSRLIGVLRDGYPLYGRRDADGSQPALDAAGGHTGTTPDSATPVYHHHVNEQISNNPQTQGERQWFLTTGRYHGAPGSCTGC